MGFAKALNPSYDSRRRLFVDDGDGPLQQN
jgi:hypothetical protein